METEQKLSLNEIQSKITKLESRLMTLQFTEVEGRAAFCMITGGTVGTGRDVICAYKALESCERMADVFRMPVGRRSYVLRPVEGRCVDYESVQRDMKERPIEMQRLRKEIQRLERVEQPYRRKRASEPDRKD